MMWFEWPNYFDCGSRLGFRDGIDSAFQMIQRSDVLVGYQLAETIREPDCAG